MKPSTKAKSLIQHWFNAQHLFCRMMDCGASKKKAKRLATAINPICNKVLYTQLWGPS